MDRYTVDLITGTTKDLQRITFSNMFHFLTTCWGSGICFIGTHQTGLPDLFFHGIWVVDSTLTFLDYDELHCPVMNVEEVF
ncbi:hypothetical protein MHYP_G00156790 [Metynnis hypsauchen]